MSYDLAPVVDKQKQAEGHLEAAIELLQPPKKQDQKDQKDQQQQQQQQQQQDRKRQQIRDREADRQRERLRKQQTPPEPVDKDW